MTEREEGKKRGVRAVKEQERHHEGNGGRDPAGRQTGDRRTKGIGKKKRSGRTDRQAGRRIERNDRKAGRKQEDGKGGGTEKTDRIREQNKRYTRDPIPHDFKRECTLLEVLHWMYHRNIRPDEFVLPRGREHIGD